MNIRVTVVKLMSMPALASLLLALLLSGAQAAVPPLPLRTELTLSHIAADRWRADYVFSEPVNAVELGAPVGRYRELAWRPLTPGVELIAMDGKESLRSAAALTRLSVEISAHEAFAEGQYVPTTRFSNGGWDFYLGFVYGSLMQSERERRMDVVLRLQGLGNETALAPGKLGPSLEGFAYFGPSRPTVMGRVNVIIDPQTPSWLREVIEETTESASTYFEKAFQRKLLHMPLISVAVTGFDGAPNSISIKGGVAGGGLAYRLQGRGLVDDTPKKRRYVATLIAHEMAHLWQINVKRGGIGESEPWIHEGGAEALMLAALYANGAITEEERNEHVRMLLQECDQLKGDVTVYRGFYACGFKRFHEYPLAPVPLWRALIARTEETGDVYSEAMIQGILASVSGPSTQ